MNPTAGLKVLALPFDHETSDALIGSYLSHGAASDDYRAALDSGAYLHGAIVINKDLTGNVSVEQSDHIAREGAQALGTLGFLAGLLIFPLAPLTAGLGAIAGGVLGEALHLLLVNKVHQQAATVPLGCAVLILAYPRSSAPHVEAAVTRAVSKVVSEATGHHVQALRNALAGAQHDMAMTTATGAAGPARAEATATAPHPATSASRAPDRPGVPAPRSSSGQRGKRRVDRPTHTDAAAAVRPPPS
jgi:uncharacterized membrane protein